MTAPPPQDIAREAVKRLAARKLPPTPENFQATYHEVAGTRPLRPFPLENLRHIGAQLPDRTPAQIRFKAQFGKAVSQHSWEDLEKVLIQHLKQSAATSAESAPAAPSTPAVIETESLPAELREQIARIVSFTLPAVGQDDAKVVELAEELIAYLKQDSQHLPTLRKLMADFAFRLSFVAQEQQDIRETLLSLLHTVFENIGDINPENPWLQGQMAALMEATKPPLSIRRLENVERRLKGLIVKQIETKEQTLAAQQVMKETLSTFLQRLSQTADNSQHYQQRFEECARRLESASSLAEMAPVVQQAIQSARTMALDSRRTGEELSHLRQRAQEAEQEAQRLREELDRMSEMASHDLLTGVLNRKGLTDVAKGELSRADRGGSQPCLALLDIDDFKRLNDRLGHLKGDAALQHLARVAKASLRPQDAVARFGGEEFVIILPDTSVTEAVEVLTRLQRELSKQFFLEGEEHILITFSAGVIQRRPDESLEEALHRADQAMYTAKRLGKNRVVAA